MDTSVQFRISGRVQGVGFRFFVKTTAQRLGLNGWVKNASDGSVVGCVEGEQGLTRAFLEEIKIGNRWSSVKGVEAQPQPYGGEYSSFEIRY